MSNMDIPKYDLVSISMNIKVILNILYNRIDLWGQIPKNKMECIYALNAAF